MSDTNPDQRRMLRWIMVALALWGAGLALGAAMFGRVPETGNIGFAPNPWRGLVVLACAVVFLGFWNLMLWGQRRRKLPKGKP